ncbi:coiled-coil domain-containing protein 93 isoform X3 [Phalaenopsis equestris]|uniref:coiled-coil domain-containing protein 93 isoform X3 n=1 Tax=Phalaenopsis equestris TaxID=78828 RepID=UPI0009E406B3|nr:coiled-coil domain-containing protein 93 isoform X3 [Phalaenopsis equestris]
MSGDREKMVNRKPNAKIQKKQRMNLGIKGLGGAVGDSGDNGVESSSSFLDQQQDIERQESGLESNLLASEEEPSNLNRSKCRFVDLDSHLINCTNKLNSLKREFAAKTKENFSLRCQLDDVPVQTELIQYERRFSELYAQIQKKHHLTRRHYATYNALVEIKELMLKEASLLNSVNLQKLEKAKLDLSAEQRVCDSLKEKHITAVAEQKNFSSLLKTFQDACTEYERLRQLATT